jgi:hypothetical protein
VQKRGQPHLQPVARIGRRLDDLQHVLVEREPLPLACLHVADRGGELREQVHEHAGLAREPHRPCRLGAEEELRELAHPVGREPASDPLGRDELDRRGVLPHLLVRGRVGLQAELRDEAKAANDPQWILAEAL